MMYKTFTLLFLVTLSLCSIFAAAGAPKRLASARRSVPREEENKRRRFLKEKAPKEAKAEKAPKETKAEKAPKETKAEKAPKATTTDKAPADSTNKTKKPKKKKPKKKKTKKPSASEAPSPEVTTAADASDNCTIDNDCADGFYCVQATVCCEIDSNSTSCPLLGGAPTSSGESSRYSIFVTMVTGMAIAMIFW